MEQLNELFVGQYTSYTGKVKYLVNKHDIIQQYCDENDIYGQFIQEHNYKEQQFEFECENATFTITKSGFINWDRGTFINGDFIGSFNNGVWNNGNFYFGNFEKSVWKNGIWDGHLFRKSIWKNGLWYNGRIDIEPYFQYKESKKINEYSNVKEYLESKKEYEIIKYDFSEFINNVFNNTSTNVFLESIWEKGLWYNGLFHNSTWLNGKWSDGIFKNSQWINGVWEKGLFDASVWVDGVWKSGDITKKSNWLAGIFSCYDEISDAEEDDDEKIYMFNPTNQTINFKIRNTKNE